MVVTAPDAMRTRLRRFKLPQLLPTAAAFHHLDQLVAVAAPALIAIKGIGTDIAWTLLTIAGDDNPERLLSEGAFAHLVGVAPIEASSGKITRQLPAPTLSAAQQADQAGDHPLFEALHRSRALLGFLGNDS